MIVLQHTDRRITRLAGEPAVLTHYFQIQEGELKKKSGHRFPCGGCRRRCFAAADFRIAG